MSSCTLLSPAAHPSRLSSHLCFTSLLQLMEARASEAAAAQREAMATSRAVEMEREVARLTTSLTASVGIAETTNAAATAAAVSAAAHERSEAELDAARRQITTLSQESAEVRAQARSDVAIRFR